MRRKTKTLLLIASLTLFSYLCTVGINHYYFTHESTTGLLITVSTNKVYYEIGEPIHIYLTITNPTILNYNLWFSTTNQVEYDIIQNNQTIYQAGGIGSTICTSIYITPLTIRTQVIYHTSMRYFLKGGMYQINVTIVGYCSRTTQIYVGLENQEVSQEFLGVLLCFFVLGLASILIPVILGLSRSRKNKIFPNTD